VNNPVVVIGMGEMGSVFARGFLRAGRPVYPVTRDSSPQQLFDKLQDKQLSEPEFVLVAVGEAALPEKLKSIPAQWHDRLVLLQNELLPRDWQDFPASTVISVWFEKKKGMDSKVILPSPAFGKFATPLKDAMASIDIPVRTLNSANELLFELVVKNLYILTSNIAGLQVGGTVGTLWSQHRQVANDIVGDIIRLQEALTGQTFDNQALIDAMLKAFEGDPDHKCMGRSAPARLERALLLAEQWGLDLQALKKIQQET